MSFNPKTILSEEGWDAVAADCKRKDKDLRSALLFYWSLEDDDYDFRCKAPGMPAEAFIQTEAQTPMTYFLKPLTDQFAQRPAVERAICGTEPRVVHLHGEWEEPDSVTLGSHSYEEVARHDVGDLDQRPRVVAVELTAVSDHPGTQKIVLADR